MEIEVEKMEVLVEMTKSGTEGNGSDKREIMMIVKNDKDSDNREIMMIVKNREDDKYSNENDLMMIEKKKVDEKERV